MEIVENLIINCKMNFELKVVGEPYETYTHTGRPEKGTTKNEKA